MLLLKVLLLRVLLLRVLSLKVLSPMVLSPMVLLQTVPWPKPSQQKPELEALQPQPAQHRTSAQRPRSGPHGLANHRENQKPH
jgi:hypothetical protein